MVSNKNLFFTGIFLLILTFSISAVMAQSSDDWYEKGLSYLDSGEYQKAMDCFDKAIEINSFHADAWYKKGIAVYRLGGKASEEFNCYDQAIKINPDHSDAWYAKGWLLYDLGNLEEAEKCYNRAREISPGSGYSWYGGEKPPANGTNISSLNENDLINSLNYIYSPAFVTSIKNLKSAGDWAIVEFVINQDGESADIYVLLEKIQGAWSLVTGTGEDATTDFLDYHGVPPYNWETLLGRENIDRNTDLLNFLHKEEPGYSFQYLRYAGNWAYGLWTEPTLEIEGFILLEKRHSSWKILEFAGGAIDVTFMKRDYGVPEDIAKELLNKD